MNAPQLFIGLYFNDINEKSIKPPFLDQPSPFSFLSAFYWNFRKHPLSVNFGKLQPPLGRGGPSYVTLPVCSMSKKVYPPAKVGGYDLCQLCTWQTQSSLNRCTLLYEMLHVKFQPYPLKIFLVKVKKVREKW